MMNTLLIFSRSHSIFRIEYEPEEAGKIHRKKNCFKMLTSKKPTVIKYQIQNLLVNVVDILSTKMFCVYWLLLRIAFTGRSYLNYIIDLTRFSDY